MNKNKENTNKKMNSYLKLGLITLLAGIGGGIFGIICYWVFSSKGGGIESGIFTVMSEIQTMILPLLSLIFIVSVVAGEINHHKFHTIIKRLLDAQEEECDLLEYEEERIGGYGVIMNIVSQLLSILVLSIGYSIKYIENAENMHFLYACIMFVVCLIYDSFWQVRYIKTIQIAHPEKKGDPSSMKFQQQWLESCDEAEREVIYQSSYKTYMTLSKMIPILLVIVMLSHLFLDTGIMAILVVIVVWLTLSLTHTRSCIKMKKTRIGK